MTLEQEQPTYNNVPPGFRLRHVLSGGHTDFVNSVAWSPDGSMLASGAKDKTIRLWDAASGVTPSHPGRPYWLCSQRRLVS